jgi:hypothetical protein
MVIDMILANKAMVKYTFPMPDLDSLGHNLAGSAIYFTLDCFKGYWQFTVSGDLDCKSFVNPDGIFTPKRVCLNVTVTAYLLFNVACIKYFMNLFHRIFTDHKNLVFLYDLESCNVMLRRHSIDKIHRWRLHLDGNRTQLNASQELITFGSTRQ